MVVCDSKIQTWLPAAQVVVSPPYSGSLFQINLWIYGSVTFFQSMLYLLEIAYGRVLRFHNSLRQDHVCVACWLIGSYLIIQVGINQLTRRAPLCNSGPSYQFQILAVPLIGPLIILIGKPKRSVDVYLGEI